jgi:hypothetical protein
LRLVADSSTILAPMRRLAQLTSTTALLCLFASESACNGGAADESDGGTTMLPGTTGPGTSSGSGSGGSGSTTLPPDDTGLPGTTSTGSGPGPLDTGSEVDSGSTSAGGEPGDWLLTVDRASSPPRLVKVGLAGGPVDVCALPASQDYTSIAFARDGTLYGHNATQARIDVIDPCTCSFQIVGPTSLGPVALGLAGIGDDGLLGLDPALDALVRVDVQTGLGAVIGPLGYLFEGSALAWSDALLQPYAVEGSNDYLYTVDPSTGAATPLQPLSPGVTDPGLAVHPNDDALYVCDADTLYGLDPGTGMMTEIGPLGLQGACRTLAAPQTAVACVDAL